MPIWPRPFSCHCSPAARSCAAELQATLNLRQSGNAQRYMDANGARACLSSSPLQLASPPPLSSSSSIHPSVDVRNNGGLGSAGRLRGHFSTL
ncbi:unnamed protein product [Gadus morhua 'NCC']